jgi:hypothetical protein
VSLSVEIEDGRGGTRNKVRVTPRGQLVVAPIAFNTSIFNSMSTTAAYNFVEPVAGKQFIITGYLAASNKDVSATTGATVPIIEAGAIDTTTATKTLLILNLGKLDSGGITGLNIITSAGKWINASTDDPTVNLTLLGYYTDTV